MANSELQLIAANAAVPSKVFDETGNPVIITPEGKSIPVYLSPFMGKIVQSGSLKNNKELAEHVRKFYFPDLDISVDHLDLVPILYKGITRTMFPPYGSGTGTQEPICRSADGFNPSSNIEEPMSMHCAELDPTGKRINVLCEYAKWNGKTPAACQMSKIWIFYEINLNIPFYWQLKSTSLSAFNKAEKDWKKQVDINRFKGINSANDILSVTFRDEGTYVAPEFKYVNNPKVQDIAGVIAFYRNEFADTVTEDESPAATPEAIEGSGTVDVIENDQVIASVETDTSTKNGKQKDKEDTTTKKDSVTLDASFASDSGTPF